MQFRKLFSLFAIGSMVVRIVLGQLGTINLYGFNMIVPQKKMILAVRPLPVLIRSIRWLSRLFSTIPSLLGFFFASSIVLGQAPGDKELIDQFDSRSRAARSGAAHELMLRGRTPGVMESLQRMTRTGNVKENYIAWTVLGEIGKPEDVPQLAGLIDPSNKMKAIPGIFALGRIGGLSSIPTLIRILESDPDRDVRLACLIALGDIGDPKARGALIHSLRSDDLEIRLQAALALAKTGDPRGCPLARETLRNERQPRFLAPALETLGIAGNRSDIGLVDLVESRDPPAILVRRMIRLCKFQLNTRDLSDNEKADRYNELTRSRDKFVRLWSIRRLSRLGNNRAVGHLKDYMEKGGGASLQAANELRKRGYRIRRDQRGRLHAQ